MTSFSLQGVNGERRATLAVPFYPQRGAEQPRVGVESWASSRGRRVVRVESWASSRGRRVVGVSPFTPGGVGCSAGAHDSLRSPFTPTGSPSVSLHAKNIRSAYYNPTSFSLTSHSLAALASSLTSSDTWFSKLPSFSDQDQ